MTKENSKKLYEHYVEIGKTDAAENMLSKYPEFTEKPHAEPSEKKEKTKKSG